MNPDAPLYRHEQRIYYEHTDAAGVVYHANYLKLYERARTEWLRDAGLDSRTVRDRLGVVFAVFKCEVAFLKPARLDDLLQVSIESARPRRTSVRFEQQISRDGDVVSTAGITVVCVTDVDGTPRSVPIPAEVARLLPAPRP